MVLYYKGLGRGFGFRGYPSPALPTQFCPTQLLFSCLSSTPTSPSELTALLSGWRAKEGRDAHAFLLVLPAPFISIELDSVS